MEQYNPFDRKFLSYHDITLVYSFINDRYTSYIELKNEEYEVPERFLEFGLIYNIKKSLYLAGDFE